MLFQLSYVPAIPILRAERSDLSSGPPHQQASNLDCLAVGALSPDLFYLLPDFSGTKGTVIRDIIKWVVDG